MVTFMPVARVLSDTAYRGTTNHLENTSMKSNTSKSWIRLTWCAVGLLAALPATGCQVSVGGQTLPSAYYAQDDVQYFSPGPEFKLSREAAAMKAYQADQQNQQPQR